MEGLLEYECMDSMTHIPACSLSVCVSALLTTMTCDVGLRLTG